MPKDSAEKSYYCTQCHIETTLSKVCPKCHRKTTLRPRGLADQATAGDRRRASSAQVQVVSGTPRWVWVLGGALATAAVVGLVWWILASRRRPQPKKKTGPAVARSFGTKATMSNRVFGAPRPGARVTPPPPPRLCGTAYRVAIHYRFPQPNAKGAMQPGKKAAMQPGKKVGKKAATKLDKKPGKKVGKKVGKKAATKPRPTGPEAVEHQHVFLLTQKRGRRAYVPLAFEIRITAAGRTATGLKLDRTGGLLPDRRTRRVRRLGYHDSLQPGLRISDLIGRVQADLDVDPAGGLKVTRQRLKNRLVSQWLQTGIGLANFLLPRPPKPGARQFEDRRLPPQGIIAGLTSLVRRFRRQPSRKKDQAGAPTRYGVDAPLLSMRRAKSKTPVTGEAHVVSGELLPRRAELTLDKLPHKGGGTQKVTLRLTWLGQRCNDK